MSSRVSIDWSSFWSMLRIMTRECMLAVGQELDGDDFGNWIGSRSPKTQIEILENAPEPIQQHFYNRNVISPFAIMALGISPSKRIKTIDRRTK